jgi:hypothetical protein
MDNLTRFNRASRIFLARLLMVHGTNAPTILRQLADELEGLEEDRQCCNDDVEADFSEIHRLSGGVIQ